MDKLKTITDLNNYIQPLVAPEFKNIIEIANYLLGHSDDIDIQLLNQALIKLSAYLFYIGTSASHFSALRRSKESNSFINAEGTVDYRNAIAKKDSVFEYEQEGFFANLYKSTIETINALKKVLEIKFQETKGGLT